MKNNERPLENLDKKYDDVIKDNVTGENMSNEDNDSEYTFVQERILKKRSRVFRFFSRVFWNILLPVCACVVVCYIYFSNFVYDDNLEEKETGTENSIIINNETEDMSEQTTDGDSDKPNTDNLDIEENLVRLEETIKKMVVVVSVVRDDDEKEVTEPETKTLVEGEVLQSDESLLRDNELWQSAEKYTGVVVSMNGPIYVLVQYENIKDYKSLYVHVGETIALETTVYDIDYVTGLALLKIEKSKVTEEVRQLVSVATFREVNQVIEGTSIVYCGNVVGNAPMFMKGHISNSSNHVSCIDRNYNMLITDIMFEGAKDGFLFNSKGNLVGIVGLGVEKIQLPAVVAGAKATDLVYIINNMLNGKKDIYFGITGHEVSPKIEEIAGGSMPRGIYIVNVELDSPAYNAGIMPGDIIYMVDKLSEPTMENFSRCIEGKAKGDTVKIGVKRRIGSNYNEYTMAVTLDTRD